MYSKVCIRIYKTTANEFEMHDLIYKWSCTYNKWREIKTWTLLLRKYFTIFSLRIAKTVSLSSAFGLMSITPFLGCKQDIFHKNEWLKRIAYENIRVVITYVLRIFLSAVQIWFVKMYIWIRVQNTRLAFTSTHIAYFEIVRFSKDYNYYVIVIFNTLCT